MPFAKLSFTRRGQFWGDGCSSSPVAARLRLSCFYPPPGNKGTNPYAPWLSSSSIVQAWKCGIDAILSQEAKRNLCRTRSLSNYATFEQEVLHLTTCSVAFWLPGAGRAGAWRRSWTSAAQYAVKLQVIKMYVDRIGNADAFGIRGIRPCLALQCWQSSETERGWCFGRQRPDRQEHYQLIELSKRSPRSQVNRSRGQPLAFCIFIRITRRTPRTRPWIANLQRGT